MSIVAQLGTATAALVDEWSLRVDLAAVFRIAVHLDWHEAVANHFSVSISPDGRRFLMNPKWVHFSNIKASDLLVIDADDETTLQRADAPDLTAWCLHGAIHRQAPRARCILHLHPPYATAMAALADPEIKPIDQNTARFYNRVAYDFGYEGMASSFEEGARICNVLGNKNIMMMGNHGVLVLGESIAETYDSLYYLERACKTLVLAYSTGRPLKILNPDAAENTAMGWEGFAEASQAHFREMKRILDRTEPSYAE